MGVFALEWVLVCSRLVLVCWSGCWCAGVGVGFAGVVTSHIRQIIIYQLTMLADDNKSYLGLELIIVI